ncbi:MAG: polar amino acid transport system substrate-binding protein [Lentisphaeria bacterium]|jgi:polar amino acid transport system substrate-binding protein
MKSLFLTLILLALSLPLFSQDKTLRIAYGGTISPWVTSDGNEGVLNSMVKRCLQSSGRNVETVLLPYSRRLSEYDAGRVDVTTDINIQTLADSHLQGFFTGNFYAYENFVYALAHNKFQIHSLADLKTHSIMSWQGAVTHLGGDYARMARSHSDYSESYDQELQLRMLFRGRVDTIQLDSQIFNHYRAKLGKEGDIDTSIAVDSFPLFGKSPNGVLFRSQALRDICVRNLEAMQDMKEYKGVMYIEND